MNWNDPLVDAFSKEPFKVGDTAITVKHASYLALTGPTGQRKIDWSEHARKGILALSILNNDSYELDAKESALIMEWASECFSSTGMIIALGLLIDPNKLKKT